MRATEQDRSFAATLLDAAEAYVEDGGSEHRHVALTTIAQLLADYREVIVSCAVVSIEREFKLKARTAPLAGTEEKGT